MKRMVNALGKLNWGKRAYAIFVICAMTAISLPAQTLTSLHNFNGTDGKYVIAGLVQAANGDFYGTSNQGGADSYGTIFKISPSGTLTTLYNFCSQIVSGFCVDEQAHRDQSRVCARCGYQWDPPDDD